MSVLVMSSRSARMCMSVNILPSKRFYCIPTSLKSLLKTERLQSEIVNKEITI